MSGIAIVFHELLAGMLFYTCFCRAIRMDKDSTSYGVMFAFWMLGVSSVVMIAAPIVSTWRPSLPTCVLMAAIIFVQYTTSRHWHGGVPDAFRKAKP